jgi:hypothetical protein
VIVVTNVKTVNKPINNPNGVFSGVKLHNIFFCGKGNETRNYVQIFSYIREFYQQLRG